MALLCLNLCPSNKINREWAQKGMWVFAQQLRRAEGEGGMFNIQIRVCDPPQWEATTIQQQSFLSSLGAKRELDAFQCWRTLKYCHLYAQYAQHETVSSFD